MATLDELRPGMHVKGLLPGRLVTLIEVKRYGASVAEVTYKDAGGVTGSMLLYQDDAARLEIASEELPWSFDADGALFRLVSEAYRISLAYLFDPLIAVHTSLIEPLPHQITAVYETMLTKQPLRYLLADDPGAGKTIMTGLLLKELMIRGDAHRCLIVAPGNLVEQWQDELSRKFHLSFDILTNDRLEASLSGNAFTDMPLCIARLDKLSRNERARALLEQTSWDIVVIDEAHKMSATFFGGEAKYTKRYRLGELLGRVTRHLLLLTATPHNGKEEDFQLFLRLLDADRFEGRFRGGVQKVDVSDLMRHLVKEHLYKFDGTPLFPERLAYTINYQLSSLEDTLYHEVTDYVRQEFNRADALENNGRKGTVGFALTTLQRRLASSPEAIYQSLRRRRARLEMRLKEVQQPGQGGYQGDREGRPGSPGNGNPLGGQPGSLLWQGVPLLSDDDLEDLDDAPDGEVEEAEEQVMDQATAARTIAELEIEIRILAQLEQRAQQVRRSGADRKWEELAGLLQNNAEMFDAQGHRLKLVIFTEHRDTLNYLVERTRTMLGRAEAVVTIHGGMSREERRAAQESFTQDKETQILVATDAAGEGINLQRAHLMVNYDLPWNPNRLEQRFGRIHRIGQTEVCHLWNLVASETREGEVFHTLLKKLEEERTSLGGQVFDVLGKDLFVNRSLRDLIVEAIRYGDQPEVRARLTRVVDEALDHEHLQALLEQRALAGEVMDVVRVRGIREDMERAEALASNASRRLKTEDMLSVDYAGTNLRRKMDEIPLWRGNHVSIKELADFFARYVYLPRLKNTDVLLNAIGEGMQSLNWQLETFAYADSWDTEHNRYVGLKAGQRISVVFNNHAVLVKPEVAALQMAADTASVVPAPPAQPAVQVQGTTMTYGEMLENHTPVVVEPTLYALPKPPAPPVTPVPGTGASPYHRFHGSIDINPRMMSIEVGRIMDEVIKHLTTISGATVRVTLEIQADIPNGVPDETIRTVTENCNTLKFDDCGFEEE